MDVSVKLLLISLSSKQASKEAPTDSLHSRSITVNGPSNIFEALCSIEIESSVSQMLSCHWEPSHTRLISACGFRSDKRKIKRGRCTTLCLARVDSAHNDGAYRTINQTPANMFPWECVSHFPENRQQSRANKLVSVVHKRLLLIYFVHQWLIYIWIFKGPTRLFVDFLDIFEC